MLSYRLNVKRCTVWLSGTSLAVLLNTLHGVDVVSAMGQGNQLAGQIWTTYTGWSSSRPVQKCDLLHPSGPNLDPCPSTGGVASCG